MTWIRVEPEEMTATAGSLQRTSDELTGVNAGIRHDCSTCLPTQAEVIADALIDVVNQILVIVATDLVNKSVDLLTRGATAATDSLTVAATSAAPGTSLVGGMVIASSDMASTSVLGGSLVGGPNSVISVPVSSSAIMGPLVGGPNSVISVSVPPRTLTGPLVGGPFAWSGPSPSESWTPITSGRGSGLGSIGNPYIAPKPWEKLDSDLDGIPNGQDRLPNLDNRTDTDRGGVPDAYDPRKNDPRG